MDVFVRERGALWTVSTGKMNSDTDTAANVDLFKKSAALHCHVD